MNPLRPWRALFVREYLEHRIAFQWVPLGILVLITLSGISALSLGRIPDLEGGMLPYSLKIFELAYLALLALWLAYLAFAMFFYFGDAFSADRRNNAMLFWKSMPVSDLTILASKTIAGLLLFPLIVFLIGVLSGVVFFLLVNTGSFVVPAIGPIEPMAGLVSLYEITLFGLVYYGLGLLWYAPFFAWVGGLSTVFGRWSLPLAFVIPGLLAVVENVALFQQGPLGGYVWAYLSRRWNFGLDGVGWERLLSNPGLFHADRAIAQLAASIDWTQMGIGLAFAIVVIWIASEYRRRRIA